MRISKKKLAAFKDALIARLFRRSPISQNPMCRKHFFGQGHPVIPCRECGRTVHVAESLKAEARQS